MNHYLFIFYLALPAFGANMAPVVAQKFQWLKFLAKPMDANLKLKGQRLLGDHKTIRGLVVGIAAGVLIATIQFILSQENFITIPYFKSLAVSIEFGFLAGAGTILGDALKSFFKRRFKIPSGKPFIPFDQVDYIIGFLIFTSIFVAWQIPDILFLLIFALIMNPITNLIAYALRIKPTYW